MHLGRHEKTERTYIYDSSWFLTCLAARIHNFHPIVSFDINRTVEEFAQDRHPRVIMKRKDRACWEAKHAYLRS